MSAKRKSDTSSSATAGTIRVGIGGWTFAPWRGSFYPVGLTQKKELEFASRQLPSIEINGTFYGTQSARSFAKWHDETPEDFVFSLKGPRFTTHRKVLAEAGESIDRFLRSGVTALQSKLGPINWQMAPTKQFDAADFEAFLKLLPNRFEGVALRHAVELRHPSFAVPECMALLAAHGVAAVAADKPALPQIFDATADFVYVRLQHAEETVANGYRPAAIAQWAERARRWSMGQAPDDLPSIGGGQNDATPHAPRDVFLYVINGFKPKAPAAARALLSALGQAASPAARPSERER